MFRVWGHKISPNHWRWAIGSWHKICSSGLSLEITAVLRRLPVLFLNFDVPQSYTAVSQISEIKWESIYFHFKDERVRTLPSYHNQEKGDYTGTSQSVVLVWQLAFETFSRPYAVWCAGTVSLVSFQLSPQQNDETNYPHKLCGSTLRRDWIVELFVYNWTLGLEAEAWT